MISIVPVLAVSPAAALAAPASGTLEVLPGAGPVLDLQACVEVALEKNDALRAERLRRQELRGQMYQALSTGLPTLDASGEWSRSRDPSFALDETFGGGGDDLLPAPLDSLLGGFSFLPAPGAIPAQTFWRASLNLYWTINPLKVIGAVGAANLGLERQELVVEAAEHQTTEQTVIAYNDILLAAEQLRAVEARLASQQEVLQISKLRFDLGLATDLDTLQAAVALANLQPELRRSRQALRNSGARLNALMGSEPRHPLTLQAELPVELSALDTEQALALAAQRPDVRVTELMADILRRSRQAQKADMRPYLTVDGAYGFVGRHIDQLGEKDLDYWRASVALNLPLFDGLLTKGKVQETEASIRRTEAETSGLKRQVRVEVLELLTNLEAARANLKAARLNVSRSAEALDRLLALYRAGKADYLSVLEAEANRAEADSNFIQARHEVLILTASLKRATGYSPLLPLTAVPGLVQKESQ
jgi:outer membrane protein